MPDITMVNTYQNDGIRRLLSRKQAFLLKKHGGHGHVWPGETEYEAFINVLSNEGSSRMNSKLYSAKSSQI